MWVASGSCTTAVMDCTSPSQMPGGAVPPRPPRDIRDNKAYESLDVQTRTPPSLYEPLHSPTNGAAAVVSGQHGDGALSHNPAYQDLRFAPGTSAGLYQSLTTNTRETPPEASAVEGASPVEEGVQSGSQYMPISMVSCVGVDTAVASAPPHTELTPLVCCPSPIQQQVNEASYTSLQHSHQ